MLDGCEKVSQAGAHWDDQYESGYGKLMERDCERARYRALGEIVAALPKRSSLLDVGCGIGTMADYLPALDYTGVDVSRTALSVAQSRHAGTFICAAAESFQPERTFDVILFNETLYYFEGPVEHLARYGEFLSQGGTLVVSIWLPAPEHPNNALHLGLISAIMQADAFAHRPMQTCDVGDGLRWRVICIGTPQETRAS